MDHSGGFAGLARLRGATSLPLAVHPLVWSHRRFVVPGRPTWKLPTLSRAALESEGFTVIERRQPSLLLDGAVLITGEVDRTTDFERGLPFHEARSNGSWKPDPLILDEQALVVQFAIGRARAHRLWPRLRPQRGRHVVHLRRRAHPVGLPSGSALLEKRGQR